MSATPCGCECKATDTVTVSEGFASVPLSSLAPEPADSLPLILVLVTVALTVAHQRRRARCLFTLRDAEPASRPAATPWFKLRLSPAEKRLASAARVIAGRFTCFRRPCKPPCIV